jgi:hypothetical protein
MRKHSFWPMTINALNILCIDYAIASIVGGLEKYNRRHLRKPERFAFGSAVFSESYTISFIVIYIC